MITGEFPPETIGGIGTYTKNLANSLASLCCNILIISSKIHKETAGTAANVELVNVPRYGPGVIGLNMFYFYVSRRLKKILKNKTIDLIHANSYLTPFFNFPREIPTVLTIHTTYLGLLRMLKSSSNLSYPKRAFLYSYYTSMIQLQITSLSKVPYLIAINSSIEKELAEYGLSNTIIPIPNAVDTNMFRPAVNKNSIRETLGWSPDAFMGLYVGRLDPRKGIKFLINAAKMLEKKRDLKLILVGDGPEYNKLQTMVTYLNLKERIVLTGKIPLPLLQRYYQAADVFIAPSLYEGMPTTVLEAMSSGLPVISTLIPSIASIVENGKNGFLTIPGDSRKLAKVIEQAMDDRDSLISLGKANREKIEKGYSWATVSRQILKMYRTLVD